MTKDNIKIGDIITIDYGDSYAIRVAKILDISPFLKVKEYAKLDQLEYTKRWVPVKGVRYVVPNTFNKSSDTDIRDVKEALWEHFNNVMDEYFQLVIKKNRKRAKDKKDTKTGLLSIFKSKPEEGAVSVLNKEINNNE